MNRFYISSAFLLTIYSMLLISISCKTEDPNKLKLLPILTTTAIAQITQNTAISGGIITSDGGLEVFARGVCWSLKPNPTINDSTTKNAAGTGEFISNIKNLIADTTYYLRAYATNQDGTAYGLQVIFKTTPSILPVIITKEATKITETTAISGGEITFDGGSVVTSYGICWSLRTSPTIEDNKISVSTGVGSFNCSITGLTAGTTYYVRAFATNLVGTAYGNQSSFVATPLFITFNPNLTYGTVTDIDGNIYKTIKIGNQTWMAENLKTTKYRNGNPITFVTDDTEWSKLTTGACCNINNNETNILKYGKFYNWYAAIDSRNIAPLGWHVPTDEDFATLINHLGGESIAGDKLKEAGPGNWVTLYPDVNNANNSSGFTALPGGRRYLDGRYLSGNAYYWSTTEGVADGALYMHLLVNSSIVKRNNFYKKCGHSVRCVKD